MNEKSTDKLFIDCEFTGLVKNAELISLCLYHDDDRYFYAEFRDYSEEMLTAWHYENVISKLYYRDSAETTQEAGAVTRMKGSRENVTVKLKEWLGQFDNIEIWGDVPAYDWVLFCDLFGGALNIPKQIHYICGDIATLLIAKGVDKDIRRAEFVMEMLNEKKNEQHNALFDALVTKRCYEKLTTADE